MRNVIFFGAGLLLTACTQQAAQVESRGSMYFGKDSTSYASIASNIEPAAGGNSYHSAPPPRIVSYGTTTADVAPLTSVGIKELDAPTAAPIAASTVQASTSVAPRKLWEKSDVKSFAPTSGFIEPVQGKITTAYGKRANGMGNDGVTYSAPLGEPVYAASSGEIAYVGSEIKSYGNMVIIKHAGNFNSSYAHLGRTVVAKGSEVRQGQIIGYVGQTGDAREPELYFAIRKGTETVDPSTYISKNIAAR